MGTLVSEVFRFVQLRGTNYTPSREGNTSGGGGEVTPTIKFKYNYYSDIDQNEQTNSLYKTMGSVSNREELDQATSNYKQEFKGLFSLLNDNESALIEFMNWLDSGYTPITKTVFNDKLEEITSTSLEDWASAFETTNFKTYEFRAWNLLFAELVNKEDEYFLFQVTQFLKSIHIIKSVGELTNLPDSAEAQDEIFKPVFEMPEGIFPLPSKSIDTSENNGYSNNNEEGTALFDEKTCNLVAIHAPKILDLVEKFIRFIRSSQAEKQKMAMANFSYGYDENGIPTNTEDAPKFNQETIDIEMIVEYLPKFPLLYLEIIDCKSFLGKLWKGIFLPSQNNQEPEEGNGDGQSASNNGSQSDMEELKNVLENQNYFAFPASYDYVDQQLTIIRNEFAIRAASYLKQAEEEYVQVGTAVLKVSKANPLENSDNRSKQAVSESDPNAPQMLVQGDWNGNTMIWDLADDEALDKMIKIGDFMRVEQSVSCYEASEIAHIENIMLGETRSKTTRRFEREEKTTEKEEITEKEEERDLQTTERFEMSREAEKVQNRDMNFDVSLSASGKIGPMQITASTGFGFSQSTQQSQRSAQQYAQSVVERARNRTFSKTRNYEKLTLIREFEDTNLHSFKNEQSDLNPNPQNNVGIYRWVDKVYKNKLINYGRRLMIEMYIPNPAAMHRYLTENQPVEKVEKPIHPKDLIGGTILDSAEKLTYQNYLTYCSYYGVEGVEWKKYIHKNAVIVYTTKEKSDTTTGYGPPSLGRGLYHLSPVEHERQGDTKTIVIDEGYRSEHVDIKMDVAGMYDFGNASCRVGKYDPFGKRKLNTSPNSPDAVWGNPSFPAPDLEGEVAISTSSYACYAYTATVVIKCVMTDEAEKKLKLDLYNKIMEAYERKKSEFDRKLNALKASANKQYGSNPGINRQVEQTELKRSFIELLNSNPQYFNKFSSHYINGNTGYPDMDTFGHWHHQHYQAVKFFEDSFEWDLMNYKFLPYFWNGRDFRKRSWNGQEQGVQNPEDFDRRWVNVYNAHNNDPTFLKFLQAGYAKVVVPVTPGQEAAVLNYLQTENIDLNMPLKPSHPVLAKAWNEVFNTKVVPTIDKPIQVGKDWETRVPTSLVILQTSAQGVPGTGLPCWKSDPQSMQERFGNLVQINPERF